MDTFESRMNPRFLAESEMGMLWEPRVIESGRGTVEGFMEDEKGKRRASVLSSFSLSRFSVIHVFMSSVHALSSLVRLVTSLRGADFWSCVSSAKSWWFTEWLAMISERDRTKRMGPSTEPRGTPYMRHGHWERQRRDTERQRQWETDREETVTDRQEQTDRHMQTERQTEKRQGQRDGHTERQRHTRRARDAQRENSNSNSKTLFYKDCSLGSVKKKLSNN